MEPTARDEIEEQLGSIDVLIAGSGAEPAALGAAVGELGRLYHAYGLEESAEDAYREAERLDPTDSRWPYYLGFLHQVRGNQRAAAEAFERVRRLTPDDPAARIRLARARLELGEIESAETLFRRSLERDRPMAAAAHAGLARIAVARGRHAAAAEHYAEALALQPRATRLHYPLALALKELGETARSQEHLRRRGDAPVGFPDPLAEGIDREAGGAALHVNRAGIALAEGRHEVALAEYRLAVAADPANATARNELGMLLAAGGDLAGARRELEEAGRLEPDNPAHMEALARVLAAGGDEEAALPLFRQAVMLDPGRAAGHLQLAAALARSGRYAEARASFDRVLELDPADLVARRGRAEVLLELGLADQAAEELELVLRSQPDDTRARLRLGEARQSQGDTVAALAEFETALAGSLAPRERAAALLGAGNVLLAAGEHAAAIERYREALAVVPGLDQAELNLAGALALIGREEEAIRQYAATLARDPDHRLARLYRAELLRRRGRAEEALRDYREALARHPGEPRAHLGAAAALQSLGRWSETREQLEGALAALPGDPVVANALARLLAASPEPAVRDGERAVRLALALMESDKSPAHAETLAMALAASGRYDEAADWQRELLTQARAAAMPAAVLSRYESNLALYEAGSPCCSPSGSG